jgi:hypothetical protein
VLVAVVALVVAAWGYGEVRAAQARAGERAAAREQQLRDSAQHAEDLDALRAAAEVAARAEDSIRISDINKYQQVAHAWRRRADSLRAQLADLPDTLRSVADAIGEACTAAVTAMDSARAIERERVASCQLRLAAANAAVDQWRNLAGSWEIQAGEWRRRAKPGIFEQGRRALPWMALGILTWELVR